MDGGTQRLFGGVYGPDLRSFLGTYLQADLDIPAIRDALRTEAFKIVVFVTDDDVDCQLEDGTEFTESNVAETWLSALEQAAPEHFRFDRE